MVALPLVERILRILRIWRGTLQQCAARPGDHFLIRKSKFFLRPPPRPPLNPLFGNPVPPPPCATVSMTPLHGGDTLNLPRLLGNASLVRRISGGVKRRKRSCRPPRGARCYIQGRRDRRRIGVESRRPRESAASLGTETVGCTDPYWDR